MSTFFKIKLTHSSGTLKTWIAVKASNAGEALVIADNRFLDTLFRICGDSVTAITKRKYYDILDNAGIKVSVQSKISNALR